MGRLVRTPLAKLRVASGIETAEEAAKLLGYSRSHILHVERGRYGASPELQLLLAGLYHVDPFIIAEAIRRARKDLATRIAKSL